MKKLITKCDLCGAEDKVTMQFNIPSGKFGERTWFHKFFNLGILDYECPTADVRENVKGEWIELELQGLMGRRHTETRCGNCGFEVYRMTPFCPNCGAKMRGE